VGINPDPIPDRATEQLIRRHAEVLEYRPDASTGANLYFFEIVPRLYGPFLAYVLYRWEIILRESAIFGILGVATLGFYVDAAICELKLDVAAVLILAFAALSMLVDVFSRRLRRGLRIDSMPTRLSAAPVEHALYGFAQPLLGLKLIGDVGVGAEPAQDTPARVPKRLGAGEEPAEAAVPATQREGVLPALARFDAMTEARRDALHMVGVVHGLPAPALHLLETGSGVVVPALVVPKDGAVRGGDPGELGDQVGEVAEVLLPRLGSGSGGILVRPGGRSGTLPRVFHHNSLHNPAIPRPMAPKTPEQAFGSTLANHSPRSHVPPRIWACPQEPTRP